MSVEELAQIIADQREEILSEDMSVFCHRDEASQLSHNSSMAQVVIGVRRSGKSTLCTKYLIDNAVNCAFVNFDDERLSSMQTDDLNKLLEAIYIVYGNVDCFFFDEIQNVESWPLFVNRLLRQKKRIFLTGSNSKLLSNELITHLTGRYNKVELYPFSFSDYCRMGGVDVASITTKAEGLRQNALHKYLQAGGFPELQNESNPNNYIDGLFNAIIRNDISQVVDKVSYAAEHPITNLGFQQLILDSDDKFEDDKTGEPEVVEPEENPAPDTTGIPGPIQDA